MLYSDGVTDQEGPSGVYCVERLTNLVQQVCQRSADQIVTAILEDLDRFAAGKPITDDQTVIVISVKG